MRGGRKVNTIATAPSPQTIRPISAARPATLITFAVAIESTPQSIA